MRLSFTVALLLGLVVGIGTANAAEETFTKPTYKGNRLAWCKDWGSGCGKGAAMAYCEFLVLATRPATPSMPISGGRRRPG